jgi:hypothetical protein
MAAASTARECRNCPPTTAQNQSSHEGHEEREGHEEIVLEEEFALKTNILSKTNFPSCASFPSCPSRLLVTCVFDGWLLFSPSVPRQS